MKRALIILMLCSLILVITVGTTMAGNPDYSITEHTAEIAATIDGEWTDDNEWMDGYWVEVNDDFDFLYNMDFTEPYSCEWCVELFTDDTDDAEDYWEICLDDSNGGGTEPQIGDYRIRIDGHSTLTVYEGNGQGWDEITPQQDEIFWADSIDSSPLESTPHWILEIAIKKTMGNAMIPNAPPTGLRVAAYDASNSEAGVQAWAPDSDADVPDEWGLIGGFDMTNPVPEGLTFAVMVFLSSVSLIVGSQYLRKRTKK